MAYHARLLTASAPWESPNQQTPAREELDLFQERFPLALTDSTPEILFRDSPQHGRLPEYLPFLEQTLGLLSPKRPKVGSWLDFSKPHTKVSLEQCAHMVLRVRALQARFVTDEIPALFVRLPRLSQEFELLPPLLLVIAMLVRGLPDTPLYVDPGNTDRCPYLLQFVGAHRVGTTTHTIFLAGESASYLHPLHVTAKELFLAPSYA